MVKISIDGGYMTSIEDSNGSYLGNGDVLEIRNKASCNYW